MDVTKVRGAHGMNREHDVGEAGNKTLLPASIPQMPAPDVLPALESLSSDSAPPGSRPFAFDPRGIALALAVLATAAAILLARYMQSVLIPFILAGLVFYALDPLVDRLQRLRVPRVIGAGLAVVLIVGACSSATYLLMDDALRVVEELPEAARKIRTKWAADVNHEPTAIDKVQDAARAIDDAA